MIIFLAHLLGRIWLYELNTHPISAESKILSFDFGPMGLTYCGQGDPKTPKISVTHLFVDGPLQE